MENNPTTPNITRFGITFPPELLKDFDNIITKMGYESRSKAIQDAVRLYVAERKWLQQDDTNPHTGIILMIYEHHTPLRGKPHRIPTPPQKHHNLIHAHTHQPKRLPRSHSHKRQSIRSKRTKRPTSHKTRRQTSKNHNGNIIKSISSYTVFVDFLLRLRVISAAIAKVTATPIAVKITR